MIKITRSQPIPSHDSLLKSDAALKLDTLPWLLPIVFMIHDFEESILMPPWMVKNRANLVRRLPPQVSRLIGQHGNLNASSIDLATGEEWVIPSRVTALAVEYEEYALWMRASAHR
jgi:hypothetical protein